MTNDKEGSSTSTVQENIALKCVQLTDSNYTTWAVLMETILKAYGLWETINPKKGSSAIDEKKTHTTKAMIFQTIPQDILVQVAQYETAKEVWDSVKVRYLGADLVQKARLQTLRIQIILETGLMKEDVVIKAMVKDVEEEQDVCMVECWSTSNVKSKIKCYDVREYGISLRMYTKRDSSGDKEKEKEREAHLVVWYDGRNQHYCEDKSRS
ncbi:hypothetical protein Tco_0738465 [Tanacetum coccineum]